VAAAQRHTANRDHLRSGPTFNPSPAGRRLTDRQPEDPGLIEATSTGRTSPILLKLVVLYTRPDDPDAFDQHYSATHMPLVDKIPGLQRTDTARFVAAADAGEQTYYRVTQLYFADQGALNAAFGSDEGKATAADYQNIAPPGSRMFVAVLDD